MEGQTQELEEVRITVRFQKGDLDKEDPDKFIVDPPEAELRKGQRVVFAFQKVEGAVVMFPKEGVFPSRVNHAEPENGWEIPLTVQNGPPEGSEETISYAVICKKDRNYYYGEGNSPPKIVIKNP